MATKPALVSHGGVKRTCDNPRNLSDEQVRAIAADGGVVGIGYFELAVCGTDPRDVVAAIRHVEIGRASCRERSRKTGNSLSCP